jgi:hypothetical protein
MRRTLAIIGIGLLLILLALGFLMVNAVPTITEENTETLIGVVKRVYEPCCQDVVVEVAGENRVFYINRGMEEGIDPAAWNGQLKGKEVTLVFVPHNWNPLDPSGRMTTIAEIRQGDETLFSRLGS